MGLRTFRFLFPLLPQRRHWPSARAGGAAIVLAGLAAAAAESATPARAAEPPAAASSVGQPSELMRQQVRQLVHEAGQLMDRGDRAGAASRLQQAQALWPDPSLDYNLGIVYAEMGRHPQAAQVLQRFLTGADRAAVLGERLEDARHRLDEYQRSLARLQIQVSVPPQSGAPDMLIDEDKPAKKMVLGAAGTADGGLPTRKPLWIEPGPHRVRVTAGGARDYTVQVELAPGELRQLSAELLPLAESSSLVPASAELQHANDPVPLYKKWWFWTAVGGGAVAVLGVSIGLIAAGASGKLSHTAAGSDLTPVDVSR